MKRSCKNIINNVTCLLLVNIKITENRYIATYYILL